MRKGGRDEDRSKEGREVGGRDGVRDKGREGVKNKGREKRRLGVFDGGKE